MHSEGLLVILVFFLQIATGGAVSLLWIPPVSKISAKFFRILIGIYAGSALIPAVILFLIDDSNFVAERLFISSRFAMTAELSVPIIFGVAFFAVFGVSLLQNRSIRRWVWALLGGLGFLSLIDLLPLFLPSKSPIFIPWLQSASLFLSALSLGGVLSAMLLGHWYLVTPTLSLKPLKQLVLLTGFSLLAQLVLLVCGLVIISQGADSELVQLVVAKASFDALCFWVRVTIGLLGGIFLATLTWLTLQRWKQTQAATGILYVAVLAVFLGEATGRFLLAFKQLPL